MTTQTLPIDFTQPCKHVSESIRRQVTRPVDGCEECLKTGGRWLHLRECLSCGHIGCCDSSPGKHATAHFHATSHPIMTSAEPGESWTWCYLDERML